MTYNVVAVSEAYKTCYIIYLSTVHMMHRSIGLDIVATPSRRGEIDIP